jgi:hypothetical protein
MYTKEEAIQRKRDRDNAAYREKVGRAVGNPGRPASTPEVIWSKVDKRSEDECWNWLGYKNEDGYGRTWIEDVGYYAHRVIYALTYPNTITYRAPSRTSDFGFVLHVCDNPSCCNPKHLFLGTHADNMADKVAKKRSPDFKGDKGPRCKLSMSQAREIRQLRKEGISAKQLAERYEISLPSIKTLLRGDSYKE